MAKLYEAIARVVAAYRSVHDEELKAALSRQIEKIVKEHMPSGAGWDHGTTIDLSESADDFLVFRGSYHHMNRDGFYSGYTDHSILVKASLAHGLRIRVTGRNRDDIKSYLYDVFHESLIQEFNENEVSRVLSGRSPVPEPTDPS